MADQETAKDILQRHNVVVGPDDCRSVEDIARSVGQTASPYVFVGVERTGESTEQDRRRALGEGFHTHPIGWGIAVYRERSAVVENNPGNFRVDI